MGVGVAGGVVSVGVSAVSIPAEEGESDER